MSLQFPQVRVGAPTRYQSLSVFPLVCLSPSAFNAANHRRFKCRQLPIVQARTSFHH